MNLDKRWVFLFAWQFYNHTLSDLIILLSTISPRDEITSLRREENGTEELLSGLLHRCVLVSGCTSEG